jgi:GAF domain-containing protein
MEGRPGSWTPSDYISRGIYCDGATLRGSLEEFRTAARARSALLLVFSRETLFQSLLVVAHEDVACQTRTEESLLAQRFNLSAVEQDVLEQVALGAQPEATADWLGRRSPFVEVSDALGWPRLTCDVEPSTQTPRAPAETPDVSCCVILGFGDAGSLSQVPRTHIERLHMQVNATAAADLYREYYRMASIDTHVGPPGERTIGPEALSVAAKMGEAGGVPPTSPYHYFSQDILDAALRLTRSTVGNIYLSSSRSRHLVLAAAHKNETLREEIKRSDKESVVAWVYRRNRPLLINDIHDFLRTHPDIGFVNVHAEGRVAYAELAVPIRLKHPSSLRPAVLGVINVERVEGADEGPYTAQDLAVVQQLAERFCLLRSEALLALAGTSLVDLTRLSALDRANVEPPGPPRPVRHSSRSFARLPSDLRATRHTLMTSLEQVFVLTRSSTATIRLLTPDGRESVRFCALPESRMGHGHPVIDVESANGVHAWVSRTGRECYLRDLLPDGDLDKEVARYPGLGRPLLVHGGPRSEVCFPLFVNGRVVGSMNLESTVYDAYAETLPVAHAVAEQVALQLGRRRRSIDEEVFSLSASTTANTHEILQTATRLLDRSKEAPHISAAEVRRGAEELLASISAMKVTDDAEQLSLNAIVKGALHRNDLDGHAHIEDQLPSSPLFSSVETLMLKVAFGELLRNAATAALRVPGGFNLTIESSGRHLGGVDFHSLSVCHHIIEPLERRLLDRLYRRPIRKFHGDRQHIGAFLIGSLVRSMGGDVYVAPQADELMFSTVVEVPHRS